MPWAMDESDFPKQEAHAIARWEAEAATKALKARNVRFISQIADITKLDQKEAAITQKGHSSDGRPNGPQQVTQSPSRTIVPEGPSCHQQAKSQEASKTC